MGGIALLVAYQCLTGFSQELVFRAYLITRLERLLSSTWLAAALTTGLFAVWHVYQGPLGTIHAAAVGLVSAIAFCWFRRLWPLWIAHAANNIWTVLG